MIGVSAKKASDPDNEIARAFVPFAANFPRIRGERRWEKQNRRA
jgi:hypothetical protein